MQLICLKNTVALTNEVTESTILSNKKMDVALFLFSKWIFRLNTRVINYRKFGPELFKDSIASKEPFGFLADNKDTIFRTNAF